MLNLFINFFVYLLIIRLWREILKGNIKLYQFYESKIFAKYCLVVHVIIRFLMANFGEVFKKINKVIKKWSLLFCNLLYTLKVDKI